MWPKCQIGFNGLTTDSWFYYIDFIILLYILVYNLFQLLELLQLKLLRSLTRQEQFFPNWMTCVPMLNDQWVDKATIGPDRMSVWLQQDRTNNAVERFHGQLRKTFNAHDSTWRFIGQYFRTSAWVLINTCFYLSFFLTYLGFNNDM